MLPCLLFEDEHLLVVNKPAGLNTHAPDPYAGEGIYDWLRAREPRWARLAIIHRLDKETSGVLVFSKTALANRSLTSQFAGREVRKRYLLLADRPPSKSTLTCRSALVRAGERYVSRPIAASAPVAETHFRVVPGPDLARLATGLPPSGLRGLTLVEARPATGRTHQIRVHAAGNGFPILGDTLYGGTAAARVWLHAAEVELSHPATGETVTFAAPWPDVDPRRALRAALVDSAETNCLRLIHGASDGWPGWYVDCLGEYLLSHSAEPLTPEQRAHLERLMSESGTVGAYHKLLSRQVRSTATGQAGPQHVLGRPAPERFEVKENGLTFELSFAEGYSVGLFLDQRDNRRRLLTGYVAAGLHLWPGATGAAAGSPSVLNTFAYTGGFSVCAARAGARTTSLDLSKKYLDWGRRNLARNGLEPGAHDFIYGDVFDWLRRLGKKGRRFDVVLLDPPTFSQSKVSGVFRTERDYPELVRSALAVLNPGGVLFSSCNTAEWPAAEFEKSVLAAVQAHGRKVVQRHYAPQPPDFPVTRAEPAYLKTLWLQID